ncbi:MAG: hypothetical protein ACFB4I_21930 [Cyanophyceae cyanobacterium]
MNTPSHWILNLALLGQAAAPKANGAIAVGAVLPDVPIFVFYLVAKVVYRMPERQIWSEAYYEPVWHTVVALFHSIPLALIGLALCAWSRWRPGVIACISLVLHSLLDLPVHHDDAHRHFFPLSDYRLISPVSYWDPNHYGSAVALIELMLVCAATPVVFKVLNSRLARGFVLFVDGVYLVSYCLLYIF